VFLVKPSVHHGEEKIEMTVAKAKTTKAKTVKATTTKAVVNEPSSPAVEHVVSAVTITPEAAAPATTALAVTTPVVTAPAVTTPVVTTVATTPAVTAIAVVTPQQVAQRAYEMWQSVAYAHGHDVEHWLAAEQELKQVVKL